jgi:release factor glutamine methyltransferase
MRQQDETINALIAWAARGLEAAGIELARREARLLLAHRLGLDSASMRLRDRDIQLQPADVAAFRADVARRAAREPLAHITGSQGFWTLDLAVSDATLIPRADSEALIESLLMLRPDRGVALRSLDLGTGTGCLLLAALSEYPHAWGLGIDLSPRACDLAAVNAQAARLDARSAFLCGNWTDALSADSARFDLVLSNPPYIPSAEIGGLMPEVARFEPRRALDGGPDGLDAYRIILSRLPGLLAPGAIAILELGAGQFDPVRAIVAGAGLEFVSVHADLGGVARAIALRMP